MFDYEWYRNLSQGINILFGNIYFCIPGEFLGGAQWGGVSGALVAMGSRQSNPVHLTRSS
jgi:hypothetical protein